MRNYRRKNLKNLDTQDLREILEDLDNEKVIFSEKESEIIDKEMKMFPWKALSEAKRADDRIEVSFTFEKHGYKMSEEEEEALWEAFSAYDYEDWPRCDIALRAFFGMSILMEELDLSEWSNPHILRWYLMLRNTELINDPERIFVHMFFDQIAELLKSKTPAELKPLLDKNPTKDLFLLYPLFRDFITDTKEGKKYIKTAEAAKEAKMTKDEIIKIMKEAELDEYLSPEDKLQVA
jgi:hypothetical protein